MVDWPESEAIICYGIQFLQTHDGGWKLNTSDMICRDVTRQAVEVSAVNEAHGTVVGGFYSGRLG